MSLLLAVIGYPAIDPVLTHVGPLAVRWYGVAYLAGIYFGYLALKRMVGSGRLRLSEIELSDLLIWLVGGVVFGGRLGWWLFYHRGEGSDEPWYEPLAMWHGGMSFHGGLVGVAVATVIWTRNHRAPLLNIADCVALVAPVGLFFGRVANFINAELVGRPTSVPWGMIFPGDTVARHPSQLYEAVLEGPVLLIALWLLSRLRDLPEGRVAVAFLIFYGLERFVVEFTRQPDDQLGFIAFQWLTMGQLLSAALSVSGIAMGLYLTTKSQPQSGRIDE